MPKTYNCKPRLILKAGKRYVRRDGTVTKPLHLQGSFLMDADRGFVYTIRNRRVAFVFDRLQPHNSDLVAEYYE